MIMNYPNRLFIEKNKFKYSHEDLGIGYEVYTKGKDWKLIVFYGEEDKLLETPRYWFIKNILTKFDGDIHDETEFKLILKLLHV